MNRHSRVAHSDASGGNGSFRIEREGSRGGGGSDCHRDGNVARGGNCGGGGCGAEGNSAEGAIRYEVWFASLMKQVS